MDTDDMIDLRTAERLTGFVRRTFQRWAEAGELTLTRRGGKLYVSESKLRQCIELRRRKLKDYGPDMLDGKMLAEVIAL